jgi:hypothetical protein
MALNATMDLNRGQVIEQLEDKPLPKYKQVMQAADIMQKDLLEVVKQTDTRVDKSLLSKYVNNVCLPTPTQLTAITNALGCDVLDIYDLCEINLANSVTNAVATDKQKPRKAKPSTDHYSLTVKINRSTAAKVFSKEAMAKLGIKDRSEFIRQCINELIERLNTIEEKENADDVSETTISAKIK